MPSTNQAEELSFADLPTIPPNMDQQSLLAQIQMSLTSPGFSQRIRGVNILRAVNKQSPSDSPFVLSTFFPILAQILNGPKTIEHKTVLVYFQEVLVHEPCLGLGPDIVSELQPLIAQKSVNGKGFIKSLAKQLLECMSQKCNLEAMLYSLLINSGNKNNVVAELSMKHLVRTLRRSQMAGFPSTVESVLKFSKELFFVLFKGLSLNLQAKRIKIANPAEAALLFLLNALGQQKFVYIIELMISEGHIPADFKATISRGISNAQRRAQAREQKKLEKQANLERRPGRSDLMQSILSQSGGSGR